MAVTPDGAEVYVTLTDTAGPSGKVWVVDNTNPPTSRANTPFNLPDPSMAAKDAGPIGITMPQLSPTPASGLFALLAQSLANNVGVLQDNPPPPNTNLPLGGNLIMSRFSGENG